MKYAQHAKDQKLLIALHVSLDICCLLFQLPVGIAVLQAIGLTLQIWLVLHVEQVV